MMMNARQRKSDPANTRDLLKALQHYEEQAALLRGAYASTMATEGMLRWLAVAARELRENHEPKRKLVHIGASANMDQSTIYRFEAGQSIPRELDAVVAAYADDLDTTPRAIWQRALELWDIAEKAKTSRPKTSEQGARAVAETVDQLEEAVVSPRKPGHARPANPRAAGRRKNA